jgi:hypothetical protein
MTTTVTITEASEPRLTFRKGDLVRCKDIPPDSYIVMVTRTAETGDVMFHGVVVYPSRRMDLGAVYTNFLVDRFVPWNGTVELQSS